MLSFTELVGVDRFLDGVGSLDVVFREELPFLNFEGRKLGCKFFDSFNLMRRSIPTRMQNKNFPEKKYEMKGVIRRLQFFVVKR